MEHEAQAKVLQLLDVISVEVAANRSDTAELRNEVRAGFGRVDRRLGNLETRVEGVETELRSVETRVRSVETELRSFRGEFNRRIAPLER
jgi:predicted  nucleic acid-binding Zn-ribbon protein